jgi:hypothetical protein
MIKITRCQHIGDLRLRLTFSDGRSGIWDGTALLGSKDTSLTVPLRGSNEFARAFVEHGALAWPIGLELAPWKLYQEMDASGLLDREAA